MNTQRQWNTYLGSLALLLVIQFQGPISMPAIQFSVPSDFKIAKLSDEIFKYIPHRFAITNASSTPTEPATTTPPVSEPPATEPEEEEETPPVGGTINEDPPMPPADPTPVEDPAPIPAPATGINGLKILASQALHPSSAYDYEMATLPAGLTKILAAIALLAGSIGALMIINPFQHLNVPFRRKYNSTELIKS